MKVYTEDEIAKYFGVHRETIRNWIDSGKFIGLKKGKGIPIKIPSNTLWISRTGSVYSVQEIVDGYEIENSQDVEPIEEKDDSGRRIGRIYLETF